MTEWEKMLSGERYISTVPEVMEKRDIGRRRNAALNALEADDYAGRTALLQQTLGYCGERLWLLQPFFFTYGCNISIGNDTFINMNCTFLDSGHITVGERCLIGPDVKIYTSSHPTAPPRHFTDENGRLQIINFTRPVTIGNNVWIGGGTVICPGVSIGDNCVIAAGSVVTKDIPADTMAAGNPCRVKKSLK